MSDQALKMLEAIALRGLENSLRLFYSSYTGVVTDNSDPQKRGRIYVKVTELGHEDGLEVWVPPVFASVGNNRGSFWPPEVGDRVRVFYKNGQTDEPIGYIGGWYAEGEVPPEFSVSDAPDRRGFVTRLGHSFVVCEEQDNEFIKLAWHKPASGDAALSDPKKTADRDSGDNAFLEFNKDGGIIMANSQGSFLEMDADKGHVRLAEQHGNSVIMDDSGIKIVDKDGNWIEMNGGDIAIVGKGNIGVMGKAMNLNTAGVFLGQGASMGVPLGELLVAWLATHTHISAAPGSPTSPPVVPPTPALLSKTVKVKP